MCSLVAYDSSSDESESEEESQNSEKEEQQTQVESVVSTDSNASNDVNERERLVTTEGNNDDDSTESPSALFKSLPPPKARDYGYVEENEDEFLSIRTVSGSSGEENVVNNPRERTRLLLPSVKHKTLKENNNNNSNAHAGQPTKKDKSVKIHVPALSTYDSDGEEEEEPEKKKFKGNEGKSGLFASLPSPRSVTTTTNRSLIPQSVLKPNKLKKAPAISKPKSSMPSSTSTSVSGEDAINDSDDENEMVSFFSFHEKNQELPEIPVEPTDNEATPKDSQLPTYPGDTVMNSLDRQITPQQDTSVYEIGTSSGSVVEGVEQYGTHENALEIDDDMLLRLQGKRRHKQEEINIIDVSQQDQLSQNAEWLIKDLSEEKSSRAHRLKTHLPTAQQRRKHQITYLAFQAKERELELKNQWSQNRLTRRQTQSKYGF